jgi:hypothetical protein
MKTIASLRQLSPSMWVIGAVTIVLALGVSWTMGSIVATAQSPSEQAQLAKEMSGVQVSLAQGLAASRREGTPISAKFEMEDGKLQLSVYTDKGGKFSEVIVDHKNGKIAKAETITDGDDLSHAKAQSEAMAQAKRSLETAAGDAMKQNKDYRVVSVMPALKDGHPVADVTLVKGTDWKTVSEKLD